MHIQNLHLPIPCWNIWEHEYRIPIWSHVKLIFTCWLVSPYFSGAAYVYEHYLRPFFMNPQQTINIWYVLRKDFFSKPDDILTAAERYIEENRTDAFEKLIHRVWHQWLDSLSFTCFCELSFIQGSSILQYLFIFIHLCSFTSSWKFWLLFVFVIILCSSMGLQADKSRSSGYIYDDGGYWYWTL